MAHPTPEAVERLARWLNHQAGKARGVPLVRWECLLDGLQETYRSVARELLTNPPSDVREAVRRARLGAGRGAKQ